MVESVLGMNYQRWTDSSWEENSLADEIGNIGRCPNEPFATTIEARDASEVVPIVSEPSNSIDARMSEVHGPSRANKP